MKEDNGREKKSIRVKRRERNMNKPSIFGLRWIRSCNRNSTLSEYMGRQYIKGVGNLPVMTHYSAWGPNRITAVEVEGKRCPYCKNTETELERDKPQNFVDWYGHRNFKIYMCYCCNAVWHNGARS